MFLPSSSFKLREEQDAPKLYQQLLQNGHHEHASPSDDRRKAQQQQSASSAPDQPALRMAQFPRAHPPAGFAPGFMPLGLMGASGGMGFPGTRGPSQLLRRPSRSQSSQTQTAGSLAALLSSQTFPVGLADRAGAPPVAAMKLQVTTKATTNNGK
jgi:hypothetical protein